MSTFTPYTLLIAMAGILFVLGLLTSVAGILVLALRVPGPELRGLANQTGRLAQKGLAEDVAGLVGNASTLLEAINQMVRTTAGVGVFLTILGLLLMASGTWLALQVSRLIP